MQHDQPKQPASRRKTRVVTDTGQDPATQASDSAPHAERAYHLDGGPEGLGTLISGVIADVQDIVRNEVRLAQAELKDDVSTLGRAAAMGIAGTVLGLVGLIIVMIGVGVLLTRWLADWLAFGLVGIALLLLAGALALTAKNRLSAANLKPERTMESLQQDKAWVQEQAQSLKED